MNVLLLLLSVLLPAAARAQYIDVDLVPEVAGRVVSEREVLRAKRRQSRLATLQGVSIERVDRGRRASSRIVGVPFEFRKRVITGEADLEALLPELYPYYGFTGRESLRFALKGRFMGWMYEFRQFVDGIPTSEVLAIWVNPDSLKIEHFQGALMVDTGLRREPFITRERALQRTLDCIAAMDQWRMPLEHYVQEGGHTASLYYMPWGVDGVLVPWWSVGIQTRNPGSPPVEHEHFWVAPDGTVTPQLMIDHYSFERCVRSVP